MTKDHLHRFLLIPLLVLLSGCSKYYYNPTPHVLPQHIRKIAVRPFTNHTKQAHMEDRLTMAVQLAFNRDGRFEITSEEQADGVVIGEITHYILIPLKHDASHVATQYKLRVLVDVSCYDKPMSRTLWKERHLEGTLIYDVVSTGMPGSLTESEAQEKIWDQLAGDIARRTFEGFGSVTGASEKSVPNSLPSKN